MKVTFNNLKTPLILWGMVTLFFAFQFILRLTVGILREDIMAKYQIDTMLFASLAGFYYLGYAGFQIPIGILLDKFHPKNVAVAFMLLTCLGTLIFFKAYSYNMLLLGRFLIAVGSASAFLSVVKITNSYFPKKYHSMMLGLSFTIGLAGAVFGSNPTKYIFNNFGYENSFLALMLCVLAIAVFTLSINDKKAMRFDVKEAKNLNLARFIQLLTNKYILIIGILGGFMVGSLEGFADLWAIPFLSTTQNLSQDQSIFMTSCVYMGMCFGGPLLAYVNKYFKQVTKLIALTGMLTCGIFIVFFNFQISFNFITFLMFLMGILCCYQLLVFIFVEHFVDKSLIGATIAIINCINMSFGWLFHKLIAMLLFYQGYESMNENNLAIYSSDSYYVALSVVPILGFLGSIGFLVLGYFYYKSNRNTRVNEIQY
jgi:predicted MFS family arabinose efflux permease